MFKSKLLYRKAKLRLYNTITFGCKTRVLKEADVRKLLVFERLLLRRIYGSIKGTDGRQRICRIHELYMLNINGNIINFIKSQRLRWFGHMIRMSDNRLAKEIYKWKPIEIRAQGRPKIRWQDDVIDDLKKMKIKNWRLYIHKTEKMLR